MAETIRSALPNSTYNKIRDVLHICDLHPNIEIIELVSAILGQESDSFMYWALKTEAGETRCETVGLIRLSQTGYFGGSSSLDTV